MDLQELKFKVETAELDAAITKIDKLGTAVKDLAKPMDEAAKSAEKTSKATKKIADSSTEAEAGVQKIGKAAAKGVRDAEALIAKQENMIRDMINGFSRGEAGVLAIARGLKSTPEQMQRIIANIQEMAKYFGDPFDSSIGAVRAITKQFELLQQRASLAKEGISLTNEQLKLYSRLGIEAAGQVKLMGLDPTAGEGLERYNQILSENVAKFKERAKGINDLMAAEKEHQKALKEAEATMRAGIGVGDAMVGQYNKQRQAIDNVIGRLREQKAALLANASITSGNLAFKVKGMSGSTDEDVQTTAKLRKEVEELTKANAENARAVKANIDVGDDMVALHRNRQAAIQNEIDKIKERSNLLRAQAAGVSAGEYQLTAMGASPDQVAAYRKEQAALDQLTQAEKERKDALRATNVVQKESQQAGDTMVAQYRKRQTAIQTEINKLKEQATALRASSSVTTGNVSFRLGNLGASASQIAEAKALRKEIEELGKAARQSETGMKGMASIVRQLIPAIGALSLGAVFAQLGDEFVKTADFLTLFEARLNFLSKGTLEFNSAFSQLVSISNEARTSVQDTSTFFSRLVPIMQSVGRSTEDAFTVTESFSKLLLVSGTSSREASSAMYQLSQALGKGKLDGDEFRTMAEAVPELLRILEKQLGVTRGELYKMSEQGKLTADVIMTALVGALPELGTAVAKMPKTVDGALVILKNTSTELVKAVNEATKVTESLAKVIEGLAGFMKLLSDNIDVVLTVLGALTVAAGATAFVKMAVGLKGATDAVGGLGTALKGIAAVVTAHPWLRVLLGVAAVVGGAAAAGSLASEPISKLQGTLKGLRAELDKAAKDNNVSAGDLLGIKAQIKEAEDALAKGGARVAKRIEQLQERLSRRSPYEKSGERAGWQQELFQLQQEALLLDESAKRDGAWRRRQTAGNKAGIESFQKRSDRVRELLLEAGGFKGDVNKMIKEINEIEGLADSLGPDAVAKLTNALYEKYGVTQKIGKEISKAGKAEVDPAIKKQLEEELANLKKIEEIKASIASRAIAELDSQKQSNDSIFQGNQVLREQLATLGMAEEQLYAYTRAKELDTIASAERLLIEQQNAGADSAKIELLKQEIQLLKDKYTLNGDVKARTDLLKKEEQATEKVKREAEKMADVFTSAFSDLISGGKSFGDVLVDLGRSIANLITEIMILEPLKASLKSSFQSSGGVTGLVNTARSFFGFADGGAFSGGVQKFANGGSFTNKVVNKPTNFNIGQMGEAGPEAIMPLMRTSSGALGVQAAGGSGSNVSVVVVNNTSEKAETKETVDSKGNRRVEVMIGDMVAGEMGRSSSGIQRSMKSTFGLQPSLVRR